jgi:hypothetical protein
MHPFFADSPGLPDVALQTGINFSPKFLKNKKLPFRELYLLPR